MKNETRIKISMKNSESEPLKKLILDLNTNEIHKLLK